MGNQHGAASSPRWALSEALWSLGVCPDRSPGVPASPRCCVSGSPVSAAPPAPCHQHQVLWPWLFRAHLRESSGASDQCAPRAPSATQCREVRAEGRVAFGDPAKDRAPRHPRKSLCKATTARLKTALLTPLLILPSIAWEGPRRLPAAGRGGPWWHVLYSPRSLQGSEDLLRNSAASLSLWTLCTAWCGCC